MKYFIGTMVFILSLLTQPILAFEATINEKLLQHKSEELKPIFFSKLTTIDIYCSENPDETIKKFEFAANNGNLQAQLVLGYYYDESGRHNKEALFWYEMAAKSNNPEAQFIYGSFLCENYDEKLGIEWIAKSAKQGYREAYKTLGHKYYYNQCYGVYKNHRKAIEWYEKAALLDCRESQEKLGDMYYYGGRIPKNYMLAKKWYEKAAMIGSGWAQRQLAFMYYNGEGIPKNFIKAYAYSELAPSYGNNDCLEINNKLRNFLNNNDLKKAKTIKNEIYRIIYLKTKN